MKVAGEVASLLVLAQKISNHAKVEHAGIIKGDHIAALIGTHISRKFGKFCHGFLAFTVHTFLIGQNLF